MREGQTLVGSETVLCRLAVEAGTVEDEPVATAVEKSDDDDEQQEDATVDDANEAEDAKTESSDTSEDLSEEEVSEMFEKLKQKADEASQ